MLPSSRQGRSHSNLQELHRDGPNRREKASCASSVTSWTRNTMTECARHHGRARNKHSTRSDPRGSIASRAADQIVDAKRATLGEIGHRLGRQVLGEVANSSGIVRGRATSCCSLEVRTSAAWLTLERRHLSP
jgi:hypothetical protein